MSDLFPNAMDFVWSAENDGQACHVTPNDPGGWTAWGVTYSTWAAWQRIHGTTPSLLRFQSAAKVTFLRLYRAVYWNACYCGALGPVGLQVFDAAVNCGPGHATGFLQTVLGVTVDDQFGPVTLQAARQADQLLLAREFCDQREEFYATRPGARYFERGWDKRAAHCRDLVLSMLGASSVPLEN